MCKRRFQDNKYVDLIPFILRGKENIFQNEKRKCKTWLIPLFLLTKCSACSLPKLTVGDPCVHQRGPRVFGKKKVGENTFKKYFSGLWKSVQEARSL